MIALSTFWFVTSAILAGTAITAVIVAAIERDVRRRGTRYLPARHREDRRLGAVEPCNVCGVTVGDHQLNCPRRVPDGRSD